MRGVDQVISDDHPFTIASSPTESGRIRLLATAPPSWAGETGRLDADRLARLCGGVADKAFYLCCPPPMLTALVHGLRRVGVDPRRIHADVFSL